MDSLSLEQLKRVTWNKNYAEVILSKLERSLSEMRYFINIPLAKRNENYAEFYSYVEIIKIVGNKPSKILDAACGRGEVAQMLALKGHKVSVMLPFSQGVFKLEISSLPIDFS
jgi:2-polyprenyl-3-methyl-5-hydroxy-6-metoxy-1,4-benzoquinol methylase